jgi:hypothetical protein
MKLLISKMAERIPDRPKDWYVDDDGFKETLEEMADQLEDKGGILSPDAAQRLLELKQEIAKFKQPIVYNLSNS